LVFNAAYDIGQNQQLTFSFGRNFDGTITKDGNLIAALNFVKGFGASRKID
jgi:Tol biopolymer transport system component